jgi:beta-lactamase superfamily II metal-dependent hydrolase
MPRDRRVLRLHVFPADHGDCLWVEHGNERDLHHVLIDGGTDGAGKRLIKHIREQHAGKVHFDLMVVTHIDADHIAGVLRLLSARDIDASFGDVWFNGYVHLKPDAVDQMGGVQGEILTTLLLNKKRKLSWNGLFRNGAVRLTAAGKAPVKKLTTGARVTVISSDQQRLLRLEKTWKQDCWKAGLDPRRRKPIPRTVQGFERMGIPDVDALAETPFEEDTAAPNGSSIGLVFEFEGKRLVLLGDAFPSVVLSGLRGLNLPGVLDADIVKLAHHGSSGNTSKELVQKIHAESWVFSTSGAIFKHPDDEAVARTIKYATEPRLYFNYKTAYNDMWANTRLQARHHYSAEYGDGVRPQTIALL